MKFLIVLVAYKVQHQNILPPNLFQAQEWENDKSIIKMKKNSLGGLASRIKPKTNTWGHTMRF